jgi:hypothetical protein
VADVVLTGGVGWMSTRRADGGMWGEWVEHG